MALPLLPAISIFFILILAYSLYQRLRFKLPPGPRPLPIVGNLYDIKPVKCRCFAEWAQVYGPIMSVWFGSTLNVIVSNPEMAKEVLKEHDQQLANRHRNKLLAKFSRDGKDLIWADYGPHYVKVRKVCTLELFAAKRLEAIRPIREDEVVAMVESIFKDCTNPDKNKSLLVKKYLEEVALNNITRLAFGKRFVNSEGVVNEQGLEFKAIVTNGLKLGAKSTIAEHIPWLRWMFPLEEEAFEKHNSKRDRLTKAIMEEHTLSRNKSGGAAKQHFVDALLTLQDQYDLSEDTIIGLLWDMITAGMDTIAISVEWTLAELIKNPRVQQKAQAELDNVIGLERVMTESDFSSLPYLQAITKETLRIHPPTPLMLPHKANTNVKIGGYNIPKGSNVHVNVWAIGRDPCVWKNPLEFRPERFLEDDVDMKGHDFRLLPFGAGRRVCPGAQLGINIVMSMLGHLLHHFSWSLPEGHKPDEIDMSENPGLIAFMKTPLQAVAKPRLPAHLYKRVPVVEAGKQKQVESEIREMMSTLTHRLSHLQHAQKQDGDADDDHGMKIITLAGSNIGATMRGKMDMDDQKASHDHDDEDSQEALGTYVNSNFQAINNSIMLGGSYSTNDPGVHMDISEYLEHHDEHHKIGKFKGKKKDKETSKNPHQSEHSD